MSFTPGFDGKRVTDTVLLISTPLVGLYSVVVLVLIVTVCVCVCKGRKKEEMAQHNVKNVYKLHILKYCSIIMYTIYCTLYCLIMLLLW